MQLSKTCDLAILVSRPPFIVDHTNTEPAHCYGPHPVTWPPVLHLTLSFLYNLNTSMLADPKSCVVFVSFCTWADILTREKN